MKAAILALLVAQFGPGDYAALVDSILVALKAPTAIAIQQLAAAAGDMSTPEKQAQGQAYIAQELGIFGNIIDLERAQ